MMDYNPILLVQTKCERMKNKIGIFLIGTLVIYTTLLFYSFRAAEAKYLAQIPTVAIPTVTSSPFTAIARVTREEDQINIRSGPGVEYPIIGILIAGAEIPALGRSVGGQWVQVAYPGAPTGVAWVYAPLIELVGSVPIVEPPPTPTPQTTPTVDPTLAAQFVFEIPPTRLPTFTPPPPLQIPTLQSDIGVIATNRIPMGFVIVGLAVVGIFGALISFLRGG
jgi:uncharacterized protein YraI